ncbi:MAG: tetratricopeptide repeat protein [Candidatus Lokiarchaeia archaeon]
MISSVYGVAILVSRGAEPLDIIGIMKENGMEWVKVSRFMLDVASQCMKLYHRDAAERVLKVILDLSRKNGDRETEGDCLMAIGRLMWSRELETDALKFYSEAARIREELRDTSGLYLAHFHISKVLWLMGNLEEALKHSKLAYEYIQNLEMDGGLEILVRMGDILFDMGRYEEAYKEYREALRISENLGETKTKSICLWGVGATLKRMGRLEEALESYFEAAEIKHDLDDRVGELLCLIEAGKILLRLGNTEEALKQFNEALRISRQDEDQLREAIALFHLGVYNIVLKNNPSVVETFEKAIQIFEKWHFNTHLLVALNIYLDYLLSMGKRQKAEEISNKISQYTLDGSTLEQKIMVNERIEEMRKILKAIR